jgi:hypothetical protein
VWRLTAAAFVAAAAVAARAQAPPPPTGPDYVFLDTLKTGTMAKELDAAGRDGFVVHSASMLCLLLQRTDAGPHTYRLVATTRESTLEQELDDLGAQGFHVVPQSVMEFAGEWLVVLEQQSAGGRFAYDVVKGDDQVEVKLNALRRQGGSLLGVVGKPPGQMRLLPSNPSPVLIVERAVGAAESGGSDRQYRIASTQKSSSLLKEVAELAAQGFRPIGAGHMTIVMERDPGAAPEKVEYQMVGVMRLGTLEREVNALAATGFRVAPRAAFVRENGELVVFLRRPAGIAVPYQYTFLRADSATIDAELRRHAGEGRVPVGLLGGQLVVLERRMADD